MTETLIPAVPEVLPEVMAWFHESEEICEHDNNEMLSWPCRIMADHLLRAFTVAPRITERPDGTFAFEGRHFHRLVVARDIEELAAERLGARPDPLAEPR